MLSSCQVSNEAHLFPLHESDLERTGFGRRLRTPLRLSRFNVRIETVVPPRDDLRRRWRIPLRCIVDEDGAWTDGGWTFVLVTSD